MRKLRLGEVNNFHKITQLVSGGGKIHTRQYSSRAVLLSAYSKADGNTGTLVYTSGSCEFSWLKKPQEALAPESLTVHSHSSHFCEHLSPQSRGLSPCYRSHPASPSTGLNTGNSQSAWPLCLLLFRSLNLGFREIFLPKSGGRRIFQTSTWGQYDFCPKSRGSEV